MSISVKHLSKQAQIELSSCSKELQREIKRLQIIAEADRTFSEELCNIKVNNKKIPLIYNICDDIFEIKSRHLQNALNNAGGLD